MKTPEPFKIAQLPSSLLQGLTELGKTFHQRGVRLLLFGSFASGAAQRTSDLDIAVLWEDASQHSPLWMDLQQAVDNLPTVRQIDLVDIETASDSVAAEALSSGIPLQELLNLTDEQKSRAI